MFPFSMNTVTQWITLSFIIYFLLYDFIAMCNSLGVCQQVVYLRIEKWSFSLLSLHKLLTLTSMREICRYCQCNDYAVGNIKEPRGAGLLCSIAFPAFYHVPPLLSRCKIYALSIKTHCGRWTCNRRRIVPLREELQRCDSSTFSSEGRG